MSKVHSNIRSFSQSIGRAAACLVALFIFTAMTGAAIYTVDTPHTKSVSNTRTIGNQGTDTFFRVQEYNVFDATIVYDTLTAINDPNSVTIFNPAATFTVTNTNNSGAGSLRQAIGLANTAGGTITFNIAGTGPFTIQLASALPGVSRSLDILNTSGKSITINGQGQAGGYRVLTVNSGVTVNISNLGFSNGYSTFGGAGIWTGDGTLTVNNCTISNNSADNGGGIYNHRGTLNVNNTAINGNSAPYGGGIYNEGGTLRVTGSAVNGNQASQNGAGINNSGGNTYVTNSTIGGLFNKNVAARGGGLYNTGGTLTVSNSGIFNNSANLTGGGIYNNSGTVTVTNSQIGSNVASSGGGIYNGDDDTLTVTNSIISYNEAHNGSGGIFNSGTLTVTNLTTFFNIARLDGRDITNVSSRGGTTTLRSSIINNNNGLFGDFQSSGYNIVRNTTGATIRAAAGDQFNIDPKLGASLIPNIDSPAIDKGKSFGSTTDVRGLPRPRDLPNATYPNAVGGDGSDIGAVERQDITPPTVTINQASGQADPTAASPINFTVVFSEPVSGFEDRDVTLSGTSGATRATVTGSGTTYNVAVTGMTENNTNVSVIASIGAGVATDAENLPNTASTSTDNTVQYKSPDTVPPTVQSIVIASTNPTRPNTSVQYIVTFSERVTGVDLTDFRLVTENLSGASITGVAFSGANYTVTVNTGTVNSDQARGILTLQVVDDDSIKDETGNPLGGLGVGNGDYVNIADGVYRVVVTNNYSSLVVTKTADTNDGACDADCSLREAITAANDDFGKETITFNIPGTGAQTIQLTSVLPALADIVDILNTSGKSITVNGEGAAKPYRIFMVNSGVTVNISNLTISNGVTVDGSGGGIHNAGGTLTVTNSTLSNNSALSGGGIVNAGGTLTVSNSTLSNNSASLGGGIVNFFGTLTITNSTLSNNSASSDAVIFNSNGMLTVTSSTISGNSGLNGGGINNASGTATLRSSIIAKNTATNGGPDLYGTFISSGYNLVGNNSGATLTATTGDQFGTAATPIDPKLGPLQDNGGPTQTHALLGGSPAIDKGRNFSGTATDQRGLTRPVDLDNTTYPNVAGGNGADIGAFEAQAAPVSLSGAIKYGITAAGQPDQFVSGVLLSATGTSSVSANSNGVAGSYTLNGLTAGGTYTVTPSKTGDIKGINSLDATRIQQHLVGLTTLTANQLIAADTDGSGTVNSLDATRIQQRAVGMQTSNIIGQWKFVPANRQYNALGGNQSGQDYQAVLVGEVSGNWATAASFADDSETDEEILPKQDNLIDVVTGVDNKITAQIAEQVNQSADLKAGNSQSESAVAGGVQVAVSLPTNAKAATGTVITIPVSIGAIPAGSSIESVDFSVFYNPAVLQPTAALGSNSGTLSNGCSVLPNSPSAGKVIVSGSCAQAITTATGGVLYNLQFTVIGTANQTTALSFVNASNNTNTFQFNNGTSIAATNTGQFMVFAPTAASVTVSGRVMNSTGRGIKNVSITLTDSAGNQRAAQTTSFGYYRFDDVATGETVTLTAKARQFRFNQPTIVRTTNESVSNADFVSEQ